MHYSEYFRALTGHSPYGFQEEIGCRLLKGDSLIFRAPTGSGKTWAAVAPFLYSVRAGRRIADRLIYALPLRSLASSLHANTLEALEKLGMPVERTTKNRAYPSQNLYCTLQMGGEKSDPFFEGDTVFCTIDQALSGYLMMPLSLPDRLGNIVAGALVGSLLVVDEVHLLESGVALATVIEMLDRFRGLIQFVLMTATMSDSSMNWLAAKLGGSVPVLPSGQIREIPIQKVQRRVWRWNASFLDAESIKKSHNGGRTLVIVNRVTRAQEIYASLTDLYRDTDVRVACLHRRFFSEDRKRIENDLVPWFGEEASETNVILVTTQVVEAGMDLSADRILTELAPMNALIQRAGRTARFLKRCRGSIEVFEVERNLPYDTSALDDTRICLRELASAGELIDYTREQDWVERVHGEQEKAALQKYDNLHEHRRLVKEAIQHGDRSRLRDLVRDLDQVNVLLSDHPRKVEFSDRRWPELLGIPRTSVWKLKNAVSEGAAVWRADEPAEEKSSQSASSMFDWSLVSSEKDLKGCWLLALGPSAASYTEQAGLILGKAGQEVPVRQTERPPLPRFGYLYESWIDHVTRILAQTRNLYPANQIAAYRLEKRLDLTPGVVKNLLELTAALHDMGKLSEDWQAHAWAYETSVTGVKRFEAIAHTTSSQEKQRPRMPNHAVEGAFSAQLQGDAAVALVVARAIAHHHGPRAFKCCEFRLVPDAAQLFRQVGAFEASIIVRDGLSRTELRNFGTDLNAIWDDSEWWPFYAYLVRCLRLADQSATAAGANRAVQVQ